MHNLIYTREKRKGFSKGWHPPAARRSCALHAPFTFCYGFLKGQRQRTCRRRANLMYHRRERAPPGGAVRQGASPRGRLAPGGVGSERRSTLCSAP